MHQEMHYQLNPTSVNFLSPIWINENASEISDGYGI